MMMKLTDIQHPHEHDVLSGRGNSVNYHVGNEYFRTLVHKHKMEYVKCPKPQKGRFSRIIVDEIKARDSPGRFLKQDAVTKLWYDIGDKKALDKTRQALREGAPDIVKEMSGGDTSGESDDDVGPIAVRKDGHTIKSSGFGGDPSGGGVLMTSPTRSRNVPVLEGRLQSPGGLLSPTLLLDPLSPELESYAETAIGGSLRSMMDPSMLPCLPLTHGHLDALTQMTAQQQAASMMDVQMSNNLRNNTCLHPGMMLGHEQIEMQNHFHQQQMQLNLLRQLQQQQQLEHLRQLQQLQFQHQQAQMKTDVGMMNLASANLNSQVVTPMPSQTLSGDNSLENRQTNQLISQTSSDVSTSKLVQPGTSTPTIEVLNGSSQNHVETLPGNNPRRMPPTSLMRREDSMKMDKVFGKSPTPGQKSKADGSNASSNHLSAMSLSIADMQEEGNLSSVFDSSMMISRGNSPTKGKLKDRDSSSLELSMNAANMSYTTFVEGNESVGYMSFGKVFEDPKD